MGLSYTHLRRNNLESERLSLSRGWWGGGGVLTKKVLDWLFWNYSCVFVLLLFFCFIATGISYIAQAVSIPLPHPPEGY